MPAHFPLFLPGEWAMIHSVKHMEETLKCYKNRDEVIEAMREHTGERIRIIGYSFPHIAGVLYQMEGLQQEIWEECLYDWAITPADPNYGAASEFYTIDIESVDRASFIAIRTLDGDLCSMNRHTYPIHVVESMRTFASLRTKLAFECRFNFTLTELPISEQVDDANQIPQ